MTDREALTIAVVEDDESLRLALQGLLESGGCVARVFASAEEYLASVDPATVDCLVADVHLPGMSGVELLDVLAWRGVTVPALLMTGRDDAGTAELIRRAGHAPHLRKPFGDVAFFEAIIRAAGGSEDQTKAPPDGA